MDAQAYLAQLQALLPPGAAWPREPEAVLTRLLAAWAEELARVDRRAHDLLREADPRTTVELLPDWERVCGLPDSCAGAAETLQQRRAQVVARLTHKGGQSVAYLKSLAATLGAEVAITEYRPFRAGLSAAGDDLSNGDWPHTFRVHAAETPVTSFRAGLSAAGEPLRAWGSLPLECAIRRAKPAHTEVIFSYGG